MTETLEQIIREIATQYPFSLSDELVAVYVKRIEAAGAVAPFKGCSEEDRAAETKHPTCAICNDAGHWISKEGVEIPCDFCMARITAENADLRARLYAARGLLRRYVRGVVECDVLLKDIFVETVDLLSRDEVKGAETCSCGCTNQLLDGNCLYPALDKLVQQLVDTLVEFEPDGTGYWSGRTNTEMGWREALAVAAALGYKPSGGTHGQGN